MKKKEKPNNVKIAEAILEQYKPTTVGEMQDALKEIFGPMFEAMLQGELTAHLGYNSNSRAEKDSSNRRNGYNDKVLHTSTGDVEIQVPRDRDGSFEPKIVPKRKKDVSDIENKVLAMYARGMSQRDISATIEDIYGFEVSKEMISNITDCVLDELNDWQNRPLKPCYPFIFVDCMYVNIKRNYETQKCAIYTILGYDIDGKKDILGLWIHDTESTHIWMQIFDEIKSRGVEDIMFISMDGVSGLEEGAKSIFPDVIVQRCIVHLIRNSIKYIPSKEYKNFTSALKKFYGAPSLKACLLAFEQFKQQWAQYPGAVALWERNFKYVEQLFQYGSAIRKVMYTTNAIESINASFRKVIKKGTLPNENAILKLLYLRTKELYSKWNDRPIPNWSAVRNQLLIDENISSRFLKFSI